jgi:hypothetical protein
MRFAILVLLAACRSWSQADQDRCEASMLSYELTTPSTSTHWSISCSNGKAYLVCGLAPLDTAPVAINNKELTADELATLVKLRDAAAVGGATECVGKEHRHKVLVYPAPDYAKRATLCTTDEKSPAYVAHLPLITELARLVPAPTE